MAPLDAHKLIRLRSDLGDSTTFVKSLVASFEADVASMRQALEAPLLSDRADIVHQVTGTAAMLAPMEVVRRLNQLEDALRKSEATQAELDAVADHLDVVAAALADWIEQAPPDGEPIPTA